MTKRRPYGAGIICSALALFTLVWLAPVLASQVAALSLARAVVSVAIILIVLIISVALAWLVTQREAVGYPKLMFKHPSTAPLFGFCLIIAWFGAKVATRGDTVWEFRIDLMAAALVMIYVAMIAIRQRRSRHKDKKAWQEYQ